MATLVSTAFLASLRGYLLSLVDRIKIAAITFVKTGPGQSHQDLPPSRLCWIHRPSGNGSGTSHVNWLATRHGI